MGGWRRPLILADSLDRRVVTFPDDNRWQLTRKLSEKTWEGSNEYEREEEEDWQPHEAHAVYECVQIRGPQLGNTAIVKVRIEMPRRLPPSNDPQQRAKDASGMRLNSATQNEIEVLQRLTAARCSATPSLLAVKIDVQDVSLLNSKGKPRFEEQWGENKQWWMPGGYIVYILMTKLDAEPLDIVVFWDERVFNKQQRDEVRNAFQASYLELKGLGVIHGDARLENLMWNKTDLKCYIIDLETASYDSERSPNPAWSGYQYFNWNLARDWAEPKW